MPLWEVSLGHSTSYGNHLLSLMLLVGGLGTIVAGPLADRVRDGGRCWSRASPRPAPLILVFVAVGGALGAVALCGVGICVIGTFGVTMVMSQEYLPRHIGMASGLSIGLSIGLGGIAAVGARRARGRGRPAGGALRVRGGAARGARADAAACRRRARAGKLEPEVAVP